MGKKIIPTHDPSRLSTVLDEKQRKIGIDVIGLESQVKERNNMRLHEERIRHEEDEEWLMHWQHVDTLCEKREDYKRKRKLEYGRALREQMECRRVLSEEEDRKRRAVVVCESCGGAKNRVGPTCGGGGGGGFLDKFGSSHR
jgi:hypothetical protein